MKKNMKILVVTCIVGGFVSFSSCKKAADVSAPVAPVEEATVYIAADTNYQNSNYYASYWKNGIRQYLNSSSSGSHARSIFVSGNDVYIAGDTMSYSAAPVAVYWKNGIVMNLSNTSGYASDANSIYIAGNNVYVAGITHDINESVYATYWKNGHAFVIGPRNSEAKSIVVSDTNVYVAGSISGLATYWKNGVSKVIAGGVYQSQANCIFISGADIYIAGFISSPDNLYNMATYWKNEVATTLADNSSNSGANSITVSGGDVYVAGYAKAPQAQYLSYPAGVALYWKNGNPVYLPNLDPISNACSIAVNKSDIYVAGYVIDVSFNDAATYWKNSLPHKFAVSPTGNGDRESRAYSIAVANP